MHRFIEYISDLLFLHDCVIIPDFGGLICNYKSARIDETTGIICPPGKDILFNRNLTHNDGLLANWIACKENVSYEKAHKLIELFCEELKVKLNQQHRIAFGDIGVFYTDRRFNVIFESGENNFLSDTFGMEEVKAERIITEEKKIKPEKIAIPTSTDMSPYINIDNGNWVHKLVRYGLAIAVCAGIVFLVQLGIHHYNEPKSPQAITNITMIQPSISPTSEVTTQITTQKVIVISPDCDYVDYDPLEGFN